MDYNTLLACVRHHGYSSQADVAQSVEHFTRNEGVMSSSLTIGFSV